MAVNIGKNILESMKVKGITQTEWAKLLGVKKNTVSQWINGVNEPNCQTIVKLCYVLEITPNEIFGWKDWKWWFEKSSELKKPFGVCERWNREDPFSVPSFRKNLCGSSWLFSINPKSKAFRMRSFILCVRPKRHCRKSCFSRGDML